MEELIKKSNKAIRHYDDAKAIKLLREWGNLLFSKNIERSDPQLFKKIQEIMISLRIAAFPLLPEREACDVLRFHFVKSFDIEVFMDNRIMASLFSIPEIPRDALREKYKKALLENNQKLGHLSVSQWINLFEKEYPITNRSMSASLDFVTSNPEAKNLPPTIKERIKETLYIYDHYLVMTILNTGAEFNEMIDYLISDDNLTESSTEYSYQKYARPTISTSSIINNTQRIRLNEALNNYPSISEQIITSQFIKIQDFPQPVRPSIKNWISDYTFILGYSSHSSVERANYLFRTQNTQRLSNEDRERLGYILKAFDEKTPVSVDIANKQIIFPDFNQRETRPSASTSENIPAEESLGNISHIQYVPHTSAPNQPSSSPLKKESIPTPQQNRNANTFQNAARPQQYAQKQPQVGAGQGPAMRFSVSPTQKTPQQEEKYQLERPFDPFQQQPGNIYQNSSPKKLDSTPNANNSSFSQSPRTISQNAPEQETRKPEPIKILPVFREEKKEEEKQRLPKNVVNLKDL